MGGGARILVIDADADACGALASSLRERGLDVAVAIGAANAGLVLSSFTPDAVLVRVEAPGEGAALVRELRGRRCDAAVVAMTRADRMDVAVDAMRAGAETYLTAPVEAPFAAVVLEKALERRRVRRDAGALREEVRRKHRLVGDAPELRMLREVVQRAAPTKATLLITGETGTGRELVAQAIHDASPRRDRPFVRVSCAAWSQALLEAELFGDEQDALACGGGRSDGALHAADGGTLFLPEVVHLPPALQVKLLRVLQSGEFERVGGTDTVRADVRVVASSTHDLAEEVREGRFRDDLYYRLNVVSLSLPPLRERRGDIPALVEHFLALASTAEGKEVHGISPGALSALFAYEWPGNVRELQTIIERAVARCSGYEITTDHLSPVLRGPSLEARAGSALIPGATLLEIEREAILRTLDEVGGSTARAAEILGISVRKIQYRLKEYRSGRLGRRGGDAHGPVALPRAAHG